MIPGERMTVGQTADSTDHWPSPLAAARQLPGATADTSGCERDRNLGLQKGLARLWWCGVDPKGLGQVCTSYRGLRSILLGLVDLTRVGKGIATSSPPARPSLRLLS